jgi:hypothetical protein
MRAADPYVRVRSSATLTLGFPVFSGKYWVGSGCWVWVSWELGHEGASRTLLSHSAGMIRICEDEVLGSYLTAVLGSDLLTSLSV